LALISSETSGPCVARSEHGSRNVVAGNTGLVLKIKKAGGIVNFAKRLWQAKTGKSVRSWSTRPRHAQRRHRLCGSVYAMTTLAHLVAVFGVAFIVLFIVTLEWYYGLLAFFALAIVLPAAWTTSG
jgi:hypothetical protein